MIKKVFTSSIFLLLLLPFGRTYAIDRVVLNSVPADRGDMRIYLLADKISWMDFENFVVQVGEQGQAVLYHFPDWYHGKYDTALYYIDINGDKLKDIVVVLNNDKAGLGKPNKDIHILNQMHDLLFKEVPVEPINTSLNRLANIEKHGKVVTILAGKMEHKIDVSKYHFVNPRTPYFNVETMEYSIKDGTLIGIVDAYVVRDEWVLGGLLGHLKIKYGWDGKKYYAKSVTFKQVEPDDSSHHFQVGKDRMTHQISYGPTVKLINHTQIKTYDLSTELQGQFDFNKLPRLFRYVLSKPF